MADPFHVRFNLDVKVDDAQRRFINRIENYVLIVTRELQESHGNQFFDSIMIFVEAELGESHLTFVSNPSVFVDVWHKRIGNDFSRCLQAIEGLYRALQPGYGTSEETLSKAVVLALSQSEAELSVSWQDGVFTKKGALLLDQHLINESLRWLAAPEYQNVLIPFEKGLKAFLEGAKSPERLGDAVTDMYEAMEAMAKVVTDKPSRDLAALREEFISQLRLPDAYKRMLKEYIDYGCDFRHAVEEKQPRIWPAPHEAEAFVYLTGLVIRLAIESRKSKTS